MQPRAQALGRIPDLIKAPKERKKHKPGTGQNPTAINAACIEPLKFEKFIQDSGSR